MILWQIASAFADTAASVDSTEITWLTPLDKWLDPIVVVALIGVLATLIGVMVTYRIGRRQFAQQREFYEREEREREDQRTQKLAEAARGVVQERIRQETDEGRYLHWVASQHRFLNITGLRTRAPVEVELERVFVSLAVDPHAVAQLEEAGGDAEVTRRRPGTEDLARLTGRQEPRKLDIAAALKLIDHDRLSGLVILGGPGTGKTTVLKYLALTFARGLQGERLDLPSARLPLFVTLREIRTDRNLADHLSAVCQTAGCSLPSSFFATRLEAGDCLVLLDGLDEVADADQRLQVAHWITNQCHAFSRNPFVVTCRTAGYRDHFLPPGFLRLDIQDFGEDDIGQFARNWCLAVETMLRGDSDENRRKGEKAGEDLIGAIQSNERVRALAVNPLMLSIIALVHRYRAHLPDRRVDLYSECMEVLLGHWEEAKELPVPIPPGKSLLVLQPLALWMHEQKQEGKGEEKEQQTVSREEIVPIIAPHLTGIGLQADAASGFLDSIRDRSGLLVERGLNVFGFQHQTFQEYLAAREIAARNRTDLLIAHFGEGYWREVTLLYAGMSDSSALIKSLLALSDRQVMQHWPLLLQVRDEALSVDEETRRLIAAHPFVTLKRTDDTLVVVRAAVHVRREIPDFDTLVQVFTEAKKELTQGHLALLLGETDDRAIETLQPFLTDGPLHVRYLCALALDILGFDDCELLDSLLMAEVPAGKFIMGSEQAYGAEKPCHVSTDAFLIDRFPLTNGQYRHFIEAGGYPRVARRLVARPSRQRPLRPSHLVPSRLPRLLCWGAFFQDFLTLCSLSL